VNFGQLIGLVEYHYLDRLLGKDTTTIPSQKTIYDPDWLHIVRHNAFGADFITSEPVSAKRSFSTQAGFSVKSASLTGGNKIHSILSPNGKCDCILADALVHIITKVEILLEHESMDIFFLREPIPSIN
jgi:hypothetical protein